MNQQFLKNPNKPFEAQSIVFITPETIEALNQKYVTNQDLTINIETLKALPNYLEDLLNKNLLIKSIVDSIDLTKPLNEQINDIKLKNDTQPLSEDEQEEIKSLMIQKVNNEFLQDSTKPINQNYLNMISSETLRKIPEGQAINPKIIEDLSIPQLESLHPSILVNYVINNVDLSKPLTGQAFSEILKYFLTPRVGYEQRNEIIRTVDQSLLPQLKTKINTTFERDPNTIDPSFVSYLDLNILKKLTISTLNARIIEAMSKEQLEALPSKIIIKYLIDTMDLTKSLQEQPFTKNIQEFLNNNGPKIETDFSKQLAEKINVELSEKINVNLNPEYLTFLPHEIIQQIAQKIVDQIDLEESIQNQSQNLNYKLLVEYQKDKNFNKAFTAKLKEKVNRQFSKYPNWKLDSSYVKYIDIGTIKNLTAINPEIFIHMNIKQQEAIQPALLKTTLENLVKNSNDPNIKNIDQKLLSQKFDFSNSDSLFIPLEEFDSIKKLQESQAKVTELKNQLAQLTQAHQAERSELENKLQDAQAQVAEYEEFKKIVKNSQEEITKIEENYNKKLLELTTDKLTVEKRLEYYVQTKDATIQAKDSQIAELYKEFNSLRDKLAKTQTIPKTETKQSLPARAPIKSSITKIELPQEVTTEEEEIKTQEEDIQTNIQNTQTKISELEEQIQTAKETHSTNITELQQKLQVAQEQIKEYEKNKEIARELQVMGKKEIEQKELELRNLRIEIVQITARSKAITENSQDKLIATLTQQVNAQRARLGLPPLQEQTTAAATAPAQAEPQPIATPKQLPENEPTPEAERKVSNLSGFKQDLENSVNSFGAQQDILGIKTQAKSPKINLKDI